MQDRVHSQGSLLGGCAQRQLKSFSVAILAQAQAPQERERLSILQLTPDWLHTAVSGGLLVQGRLVRMPSDFTQEEVEELFRGDKHDVFSQAQVCFLGVAISSVACAVGLGFVGAIASGRMSWSQMVLQAVGGALGAHAGAVMHKEQQAVSGGRFLKIFAGASVGSLVSGFAVPLDDLCVLASAVLTGVGAVSVALFTDVDLLEAVQCVREDVVGAGRRDVETAGAAAKSVDLAEKLPPDRP